MMHGQTQFKLFYTSHVVALSKWRQLRRYCAFMVRPEHNMQQFVCCSTMKQGERMFTQSGSTQGY